MTPYWLALIPFLAFTFLLCAAVLDAPTAEADTAPDLPPTPDRDTRQIPRTWQTPAWVEREGEL